MDQQERESSPWAWDSGPTCNQTLQDRLWTCTITVHQIVLISARSLTRKVDDTEQWRHTSPHNPCNMFRSSFDKRSPFSSFICIALQSDTANHLHHRQVFKFPYPCEMSLVYADIGVCFEESSKRFRVRFRQNHPGEICHKVTVYDQLVLEGSSISRPLDNHMQKRLTPSMPEVPTRSLVSKDATSS